MTLPGLVPWCRGRSVTAVLGLAHHGGAVVLAWDNALRGARDPRDGRNVVIHELAHKIDFLDGSADGTPPLPSGSARREWIAAFAPASNAAWRFPTGRRYRVRGGVHTGDQGLATSDHPSGSFPDRYQR